MRKGTQQIVQFPDQLQENHLKVVVFSWRVKRVVSLEGYNTCSRDLIHNIHHQERMKAMSRGLLRGKQVIKSVNTRNRGLVCLWQIMGGNDHRHSFSDAVSTAHVLTASNKDVNRAETRAVHFATLKSSSRFEKINKFLRDYLYWQILSLVCPLKYHVSLLLSLYIVNKGY